MSFSVIGAGFGRTGTLSLKGALETLGVGPCYHMVEVQNNPTHSDFWRSAADGGHVNWDTMFENYDSTVDWPACHFWKPLAEHFPQAKVLLSVRDPEKWYASVSNTIYKFFSQPLPDESSKEFAHRYMTQKIIAELTFSNRFTDKEFAISVYEKHIETVKNTISEDRLLVFNVADGWLPLCDFLNVPVPDVDFPRVNSTAEFQQMFAKKALQQGDN
ncbi:MAG: hypothetical protein JKX83_01185 [Pseudomonadales bacterium]|nr:hypothetical protein [Pseudomonadales bacterium]